MAKTTRHGGASNKAEYVEPEQDQPLTEDEPTDEYDTWTNDQLRDELAERELPTSGNKAELVARLRDDDSNAPDAD